MAMWIAPPIWYSLLAGVLMAGGTAVMLFKRKRAGKWPWGLWLFTWGALMWLQWAMYLVVKTSAGL